MYYDERENSLDYTNVNNKLNNFETNYSENKKWDNDIKFDINNINFNNYRATSLFSKEEGLNKGNMFKGEYIPYKNYIYKVVVSGERDELLLLIQQLTFKQKDLNLYLDIHPNDSEVYNEFKTTSAELKKYKDLYEKNYGPLCIGETSYYTSYKWIKNPWPWSNEGGNR